MSKSKAYADTTVAVDTTQAAIAKILRAHGAKSIQWEWKGSSTILRFVWTVDRVDLRARFTIEPELDRAVKIRRGRGQSHTEARDRRLEKESMRLHRVLHWYLKTIFEAEEAGLLRSDAALLGWIEDASGATVAEVILPRIAALSTTELLSLPPVGRK